MPKRVQAAVVWTAGEELPRYVTVYSVMPSEIAFYGHHQKGDLRYNKYAVEAFIPVVDTADVPEIVAFLLPRFIPSRGVGYEIHAEVTQGESTSLLHASYD